MVDISSNFQELWKFRFGSDHVLSVSNLLVTSRNLSVASHKSKSQRFAGSRQHDLNEVTAEQRPCKLLAVGPNHRFDSNARAAPTTHCEAGNTVFNHIFLRLVASKRVLQNAKR